jgi:3-keto-L-gulonate-6-phosphate decarboxylase
MVGDVPVLADMKTADGGAVEAELAFRAGAMMMTVLSNASPATHDAVHNLAVRHDASVVADTIIDPPRRSSISGRSRRPLRTWRCTGQPTSTVLTAQRTTPSL